MGEVSQDALCVLESVSGVVLIDLSSSRNFYLRILQNMEIPLQEVEKSDFAEMRIFISVPEISNICWDLRILWPGTMSSYVKSWIRGEVFVSLIYVKESNRFHVLII